MLRALWKQGHRALLLTSGGIVGASLAGCDVRHPAATAVPPPSISSSYLDVDEPLPLGSPHDIPENSGVGEPDWVQATNIGTLPDSAWIVIEVQGTVLHTKHWWCDELYKATGGCNYPLDGVRLGPLEGHGGSRVIVSLLPPGVVPNPYYSIGVHQYPPDGNDHGDLARSVVRNTTGPKVVWYRRIDATPKPTRNRDGARGPMYNMFSDQKVSARVVPTPLRVDAPATVRPREVATFSVSPTSDFKFKMPDGDSRRHFVYWRYFPGDTAARPNPAGQRQDIPCGDSIVCRWTPPKSGRVWAFTYVDGFGVEAKSQVVRIDTASLELTCPESVTRGSTLNCTVAARPNGTLTDVAWRFVPPSPHPSVSDTGRTAWSGAMALGGRIEVSARVNGEPQLRTDTATVTVTPRNWAGRMPYPAALPPESIAPHRFALLPVTQDSRGYDVWIAGALGEYSYAIDWFGRFTPIASGPNKGYWFLREPPEWADPIVYLSGHLQPGHRFYEAQTGRRPGQGNPPRGYSGWCTKADMDILRDEVRDHEGSLAGPRLSHHEFNINYTAQNDPGPAVEGVIFFTPTGSFAQAADAEIGRAYLDAMSIANNAAVHAQANLYTVPCKVHMP